MARLIKSRYRNIKSGWKCVFAVLGAAARHSNEQLVISCYDTMITTLDLYFPMIEQISTRPLSRLTEEEAMNAMTDVKMAESNDTQSNNEKQFNELQSQNPNDHAIQHNRHGHRHYQNDISGVVSEESVRRLKLLRTDALSDCVDTLIAFVQNQFTDLSISAIDYLSKTAQYLFDSDHYLPVNSLTGSTLQESEMQWASFGSNGGAHSLVFVSNSLAGGIPDMSRPLIKAWFLCLLGLSKAVNDRRLEVLIFFYPFVHFLNNKKKKKNSNCKLTKVRTHALTVMFRLLRAQGSCFDELMWTRSFQRLIFPVFAELRQSMGPMANANCDLDMKLQPLTKTLSETGHHNHDGANNANDTWSSLANLKSTRLVNRLSDESIKISNKVVTTPTGRARRGSDGCEPKNRRNRSQSNSNEAEDTLITKVSIQTTIYEEYTWLETTCHPALSAMVELFNQFFTVENVLLHEILLLLTNFISMKQSTEASQIGLQCLTRLIEANSARFTTNHWSIIITDIIQALHHALPRALISNTLKKHQSQIKSSSGHEQKVEQRNGTDATKESLRVTNPKEFVVLSESLLNLLQLLRQVKKEFN
ncbi:hypothetical protein RFI_26057, partial [Reticulomyxa filosa]